MNDAYKSYNKMLSARGSEFRLKPQGDKLTLITTDKILIKREVPIDTLHLYIESVLAEEFGMPVTAKTQQQCQHRNNSSSSSSSSSDGFTTGLIIGGLFL